MWEWLWQTAERNLTTLLWQGDPAQANLITLHDASEIRSWGEANLARFTPLQLAILIARLPQASHRVLVIASLYPLAQQWRAEAHATALQQAYTQSGWPLLVEEDGIDVTGSAAIIVASVALGILEASGIAHERLRADRRLWEIAPAPEINADVWSVFSQPATLAAWGIEAVQVGEFLAKQSRWLLSNPLVDVLLPLPLQVVTKGIQVATSDLAVDAAQVAEGNLELWRRRQALEQRLFTVPNVALCQEATPAIVMAVEAQLRPVLARHLLSLARLFDPPLRNRQLDGLGRQLNALNPWQYLQGWFQQQWLEDWQVALPTATYPELMSIQL